MSLPKNYVRWKFFFCLKMIILPTFHSCHFFSCDCHRSFFFWCSNNKFYCKLNSSLFKWKWKKVFQITGFRYCNIDGNLKSNMYFCFSLRLSEFGESVGSKLIDIVFMRREKNYKREIKLLDLLIFIKSTFWKVCSNSLNVFRGNTHFLLSNFCHHRKLFRYEIRWPLHSQADLNHFSWGVIKILSILFSTTTNFFIAEPAAWEWTQDLFFSCRKRISRCVILAREIKIRKGTSLFAGRWSFKEGSRYEWGEVTSEFGKV